MKKMTALQRNNDGLCQIVELATMDGIRRTTETTEIRGWGRLDGPAEVWVAKSGAYEILVPAKALAASLMGSTTSEAKAVAARENGRKGGRPRTKTPTE